MFLRQEEQEEENMKKLFNYLFLYIISANYRTILAQILIIKSQYNSITNL